MMRVPRVSVLMPSYNHAAYVKQAVESVLSQSFTDLELVITDDGSVDETVTIIEQFDDPRISLEVFKTNRGAAEATNRCLERARGEFIALLNSDDFFLPDKITLQMQQLSRHKDLAAVFSQACFVDDWGSAVAPERNPFASLFTTVLSDRYEWLNSFFFNGNGLCHPTVLMRREVCDELGPYDVSLRQLYDFDMWVRLCARHQIAVMPEALLAYRVLTDGGNMSAPGPSASRRTSWEHTRIRRRYRSMDEDSLRRTFAKNVPVDIAARELPMLLQLALTVGESDIPQLQLFALETLQDAVDRQVAGGNPKDLHRLAGAVDPFRQTEFATLSRNLADITRERDEARLQVEGLAGFLLANIEALRTRDSMEVAEEINRAMAGFRIAWSAGENAIVGGS